MFMPGASQNRSHSKENDILLPANPDAERFILGSILLNDSVYPKVVEVLGPGDFILEKHRRILARMRDLHAREERIDRVTVANELMKLGQLESVDGLSYLVSLDDGLPEIANLESYIRIAKDKAGRWRRPTARLRFNIASSA
jgi:replicative DNA helicase